MRRRDVVLRRIHDYSHTVDGLKIGEPAEIVVRSDGREQILTITANARVAV